VFNISINKGTSRLESTWFWTFVRVQIF